MTGMTPTQEVDLALANAHANWDEMGDADKLEFPRSFFDKARSLANRLEQADKVRLRALSAVAEAHSHFPNDHALLEAHRTLASNKLDEQPNDPPINAHGGVPKLIVESKCSCGQPVLIEMESKRTSRRDRKRIFYPDQEDTGFCVFRCKGCGDPISDSCPDAAYG